MSTKVRTDSAERRLGLDQPWKGGWKDCSKEIQVALLSATTHKFRSLVTCRKIILHVFSFLFSTHPYSHHKGLPGLHQACVGATTTGKSAFTDSLTWGGLQKKWTQYPSFQVLLVNGPGTCAPVRAPASCSLRPDLFAFLVRSFNEN